MGLVRWLEARSGWPSAIASALSRPTSARGRLGRAFAPAALGVFLLLVWTGFGIALGYSASTTHAWASLDWLQTEVPFGWLLRGLHEVLGGALVVLALFELFASALRGDFRRPRELIWWCALLGVFVVISTSHLGFLLRGDQSSYWRAEELFSILGSIPLVGHPLANLVRGGSRYGTLTLARLFALHAFLLPVLLFALLRVRARASRHAPLPEGPSAPYFPAQARWDLGLFAAVLIVVIAIAVWQHGAMLFAPADPTVRFPARPEWYFVPLFELRRLLGRFEWLATWGLPGLGGLVLFLLPFLDAKLAPRRDLSRPVALALALGLLFLVVVGVRSSRRDAHDPKFVAAQEQAARDASEAQRLARAGVPPQGPQALYLNDPVVWGRRMFSTSCSRCHQACTQGKKNEGAPCLEGYRSRVWLTQVIRHPRSDRFFGNTKIDEMDPYQGSDETLSAIVEYLYAQGASGADPALAKKGEGLFASEGCSGCHVEGGEAPSLQGYGSPEWLAAFIRTPGSDRFYGEANEMKAFGPERINAEELSAVVAYLRSRENEGLKLSSRPASKPGTVPVPSGGTTP